MEFIVSLVYVLGVLIIFSTFVFSSKESWEKVLVEHLPDYARHWIKSVDSQLMIGILFLISLLWPIGLVLVVLNKNSKH